MRKRALGLAVALIVGAFVVSASGAATTRTQTSSKINVSTRAAVIHYLRSIHISTKGVVIQRGLRNYAGADCPGKGWTCAKTKHTVVQIAKRNGLNRYACSTAKCAVVQFGSASRVSHAAPKPPPTNTASCIKTTGVTQTCTINQPSASGTNTAIVWMVTPKLTGLTQSSYYSASITQGPTSAPGSSNNNVACVNQSVYLDASTTKTNGASTTVTNDNHESISIQQNSLTGNNTVQGATQTGSSYVCGGTGSQLTQDEKLSSVVTSKGSITQNQDTLPGTTSCVPPGSAPFSGCANVVTDIEQNQNINGFNGFFGHASGVNSASFEQSTNQSAIANTVGGATVTQQQDANVPSAPYSGLVGTINQDSSAMSTASATQTEIQCQDAINTANSPAQSTCDTNDPDAPAGIALTQTQYGPEGILTLPKPSAGRVPFNRKGYGASGQTGNSGGGDSFALSQTSTQNADLGSGQQNIEQGDCSSSGGSCTASQLVSQNSGTTQTGWTAPSIGDIHINCPKNQTCTASPPPDPTFISGPTSPNPSSSAAFNFSDPATGGIHFLCKIDGGTAQENVVDPCFPNKAFFQDYGAHTFQVAASDKYGHVSNYVSSNPVFSWTNVPPDPTITSSAPPNPDFSGNSYTFTFTDTADPTLHFQCQIDNQTPTACNTGTSPTYSGLSAGSHTFKVTAYGQNDSTLSYPDTTPPTQTWTILPLSISANGSNGLTNDSAVGTDGSKAAWECKPGGPIALTAGTQPYDPINNTGAGAEIDLLNAPNTDLSTLSEPTFMTDNYGVGTPRYYIVLDNGSSLWGYPPPNGSAFGGPGFGWAINNGNTYASWADVVAAEPGATVISASVIADAGNGFNTTANIWDLQFNGATWLSTTCS